jgi:hypothetical protein
MFNTKHVSSNVTTTPKPPKLDNVPINVVVIIIICNQQLEQQVLKKRKLVKIKGVRDWQQKECFRD